MDSSATPPLPPRQRIWLRRTLIGGGAVLVLLGGAAWLLGRETTLQQLFAQIARASGGQIVASGVRGSLYGRMHIGRIVYRDATSELTLDDIDIAWSPLQYFSQGVAISELHVAQAQMRSTAPSPPAVMPASLAPPFRLQVSDGRLDKLTLVGLDGSRQELRTIRLKLQGDGQRWRLQEATAETPLGALAASGEIAAARPFAVSATLALAPMAQARAPQAPGSAAPDAAAIQRSATRLEALASGNLAQLTLKARGASHYANGDATLVLAPFEPVILHSIALQAQGIDPARFDPAWPQANLALSLQAQVGQGERLSGKLSLANRSAPGPFDKQRLPLAGASAQLGGTLQQATLHDVLLDLGAAGRFSGGGALQRTPDGLKQAAFKLRTERLDLQALHTAAIPTAIAGEIRADTEGKTHTLRAHLGEGKLQLDAHASLRDLLLTVHQFTLQAGKGSIALTGQASMKEDKAFQARASASHFDPAALGRFPAADLNAQVNASGKLAPDWRARAELQLQSSTLLGQPLSGNASLQADARHVFGVDARLAFGRNNASARGAFGMADDQLAWQLDAAQLSAIDARLQGSASASGTLGGGYRAPRSSFNAEARGLGWLPAAKPAPAAAPRSDSVLRVSGEVLLNGAPTVNLAGSASRLNPASFGAPVAGSINADFSATLRASADWLADADIRLQPASLLGGTPFTGRAVLSASPGRVQQADIDLHLGQNALQARGAFGKPQDRVDWQLDAPQLASLGTGFGGSLRGSGFASGGTARPTLGATLDGAHLRLPGQREIAAIRGSATIGSALGPDDPVQADLTINGYSAPGVLLDRVRLQASGTGSAHVLQLAAANPDFDAAARLRGSVQGDSWNGSIETLQNRGRFAFTLQAPASLRVVGAAGQGAAGLAHPEQLSLGSASIAMPEGSLRIDTLEKNGARWRSKGSASGVNASYLAQLSDTWRQNIASTMTLGADWSLELAAAPGAPPALDGNLHVFREKGDITVTGGQRPQPLGLRTLDARLTVGGGMLRASAELAGARSGSASLSASAQLRDGRIPADSPLTFSASADLPSIAWLSPLAGVTGLELDGALRATAQGRGTVAAPQLDGEVTGEQLVVNWAEQGIRLRNGQLQARVAGDQLQLQRLRFDGAQGSVQADGWLRLANSEMTMDLQLAADKLEVFARPDRTLVLSGRSTLQRDARRFQLDGKFRADRASIELPSLDAPTISEDVVILGRDKPKTASQGMALAVDVEADLGDDFTLRGKGLDAQLAGTVRLRLGERRAPRVNGSIHVVSGTYAAYGQRLAIERGVLNFSGAYDNPGLNIRAVRKRPEGEELSEHNVEAGVEVRGTALAPSAKLVSTPSVPDSEKLAWLVLGHGTADMAGNEMSLLGTAAGALLGGRGGPSLANRVGLDELGVTQAKGLESTVVTVGKKLSSRAYLSFEQGTGTATSLVKLRYKVNPRVTLQLQTGTNNALDVLYNWAFD